MRAICTTPKSSGLWSAFSAAVLALRLGLGLGFADMIRRYNKNMAMVMMRMLKAFDSMRDLFLIITEKTLDLAAKDAVSFRHGLAGMLK